MPQLTAAGRMLEYHWIDGDPARPVLVFLHEGLGSTRQWRDFPGRLAAATGCAALVYDRCGHGQSEPLAMSRAADFMHREACESLPGVLAALGIAAPVLVGHSDGGSIALIHAGSGHPVRGLAVIAPHVFVEDFGLAGIREAKQAFETGTLRERLAKYHRDVDGTFYGWSDVWLSPAFRDWNIEPLLAGIRCPVLAIQGEDDPYGTMAQIERIASGVGGPCRLVRLAGCGHNPPREMPEATLAVLTRFVTSLA